MMATSRELVLSLEKWFESADDDTRCTLEAFANGQMHPNAAAIKIATIYEPHLQQGNARKTDELWKALVDVAVYSGRDRALASRMVTLLNSLSEQGDVADAATASTPSSWARSGLFWRNLPGFSFAFREQAFG